MIKKAKKYTAWYLYFAFVVLGAFWVGYLIWNITHKPTLFEVVQEQVEELIEYQQSRVPLITNKVDKK